MELAGGFSMWSSVTAEESMLVWNGIRAAEGLTLWEI